MLGLQEIKSFVYHIFHRYDDYLVMEILNHYLQLTFLKVNIDKKEILVTKNWFRPISDFRIDNILAEAKLLFKKIRRLKNYRLILSLDSQFASTIYASVPLVRSHPKEVIDEADLDNLISQAVWRFFDKNRLRVAQKLNVADVDVILADVRIRGIKIDGHRVVNPIGFKAKSVEISFSQTFLVRDFLRGLREFISNQRAVLITEAGTALNHVLAKALNEDSLNVINIFPNQTIIFSSAGSRIGHLDNFDWGEKNLNRLLYRHLRLDDLTAKTLIQRYIENGVSESFKRRLENLLLEEFRMFGHGLESLAQKNSTIYLNPYFTLPALIHSDKFRNRLEEPLTILPLSTQILTEKLGYAVKWKPSVSVKNPVSVLAAFLESTFLPEEDKINHLANRRVRWLIN